MYRVQINSDYRPALLAKFSIAGCFLLSISTPASVSAAPVFFGLGALPEGQTSSANGVSGNGRVVIGTRSAPSPVGSSALRWTAESGSEPLGWFPGGNFSLGSRANWDGSVVAGAGGTPSGLRAFRWTIENGLAYLGTLQGGTQSVASSVNNDGSVVVGWSESNSGRRAFRWSNEDGMMNLGTLPNTSESVATGINGNGTIIVGYSFGSVMGSAFRWTPITGMVSLGVLPGGSFSSANDVNDDGTVIVGSSQTPYDRAFRWTPSGGMMNLGLLPGSLYSVANAVSADGSTIVGFSGSGGPNEKPFIWTQTTAMISLQDYLAGLGVDFAGWKLNRANGISDDGFTIIGSGIHNGVNEGWIAVIPEPSTTGFVLFGALFILRNRKLSRTQA